MARPIRSRPRGAFVVTGPPDSGGVAARASAPVEELFELLRLLDERGFLRFSTDLLRAEDRVVEVLTERLDPRMVRSAVRNLEVILRALEGVDPVTLRALAGGIPRALEEAHSAETGKPMGLLEMANALRDPAVNRGVRMILGFLRGIGAPAEDG